MNFGFQLILASKSPRRQLLLRELGIPFELRTKEVDESFPEHLVADEIPLYLCRKKADAFAGEIGENEVIVTADTIVWINGHVLNKPADKEEARVMLMELSGNRHEVYTGVCLKSQTREHSFSVRTDVFFKALSKAEIDFYIDTYKPFDKAGAYGAQESLPTGIDPCSAEEKTFLKKIGKPDLGLITVSNKQPGSGSIGVERIDGSYFNVMGLPVMELWEALGKFEV